MTHAAGIWEPKARVITSLGREKEVSQKARITQSTVRCRGMTQGELQDVLQVEGKVQEATGGGR